MNQNLFKIFYVFVLMICLVACSTPEEKAEKYYQKGMELLESDPEKAKLEFQNALQMKKNMTKAMYGLALVSERKGDWKATFGLMSQVVEQDPNHIEALIKTGQILLAGGKIDMALERSNKALALDKENIQALNLQAAVQLKLNNSQGAVEYANKSLAKDPKNQDAYVILASERIAAKDDAKAVEYLDKALAINEKNLPIQLLRIKALENQSKQNEAEASFEKVVKLFPTDSFSRKSYAQYLMKYNRKDDAEKQMRAIVDSSPKSMQAKLELVNFLIATKGIQSGQTELETLVKKEPKNYDLAFSLVNLYQVLKNSEAEDRLLDTIATTAGNSPEGLKARAFKASKLVRLGKKEEAKKVVDALLAIDKRNEQALTLKAGFEIEAKNYDAAIVDLRTILRDNPDYSKAALMLAWAHESSGSEELADEQYLKAFVSSKFKSEYGMPYHAFLMRHKHPERAEKILEQMVEANPKDTVALRNLAQVRIQKKDFVGAQKLADQAKSIGVQSTLSDQILGAIASEQKDIEGTLTAFKRAYVANPKDTQPIIAIVRTYVQANRADEAIAFINSVIKDNPNNLEAKLMLGQIYLSKSDYQKSNAVFSEVIQQAPNNPVAYQQLAASQQQNKQYAEAEKTISDGLAKVPNDFGLKMIQAGVFELNHKVEDAIKVYEELIKTRPDSEVVANNLASLLSDHRTDADSFKRAYEVAKPFKDSPIPQFLDTFGWAAFKAGKNDEAEVSLKAAVTKLPESAIFHYHLAKLYIANGNTLGAKQALQNAIKYSEKEPFAEKEAAMTLLKTL
jgi:cellulose synthase operon protein C